MNVQVGPYIGKFTYRTCIYAKETVSVLIKFEVSDEERYSGQTISINREHKEFALFHSAIDIV